MNSLSQKKTKNNLEAGTENSDPDTDTNSEGNNNNTPHLSDLRDLQEPFDDEDLSDLLDDEFGEEKSHLRQESKAVLNDLQDFFADSGMLVPRFPNLLPIFEFLKIPLSLLLTYSPTSTRVQQ